MYPQGLRRLGLAAGLITSTALVLAGCGGSSGTGSATGKKSVSDSTPSSAAMSLAAMQADLDKRSGILTSLPAVTPVINAASLRGKTVWWIPLGPPIDAAFGPSVKQSLDKLGVKMQTCDGKFLPTTAASCLQQAGDQNADAVMTAFVDYKSIPTAFDALAAKGIPILVAGATNNSGKAQAAKFAFADTNDIGEMAVRMQLEKAIVDGKGKAKLLWVGFDDSAQLKALTPYARSFVEVNCPDCSFNQVNTTSAAMPKLASQVGAALTSRPDTDYVVVQIGPGVAPVLQAVQTSRTSNVKVIGAGLFPDTLANLQSGSRPLLAVAGASLAYEGLAFTQQLAQMMTGTVPPEQIQSLHRTFTSNNVKDFSSADFTSVKWFADTSAVMKTFTNAWSSS